MHTILGSSNCDCNVDEVPLPVIISSSILAKASICATCLDMRSQSAEVPAPTGMEWNGMEGKGREGKGRKRERKVILDIIKKGMWDIS